MAAPGPSFAAAGRDAIECAIYQPGSWSEKVITASCLKAGRDRQAKHHNFNPKLEMTKLVQIARPVEHDAKPLAESPPDDPSYSTARRIMTFSLVRATITYPCFARAVKRSSPHELLLSSMRMSLGHSDSSAFLKKGNRIAPSSPSTSTFSASMKVTSSSLNRLSSERRSTMGALPGTSDVKARVRVPPLSQGLISKTTIPAVAPRANGKTRTGMPGFAETLNRNRLAFSGSGSMARILAFEPA